ncbi:hypothetical protein [Streptomyces sp. NPDC046821]|uniref:hypothetical protein n=1 Tax=Streptomyces sp. NPDC046821 TaxID=3154702 RepID=UPI00340304EB
MGGAVSEVPGSVISWAVHRAMNRVSGLVMTATLNWLSLSRCLRSGLILPLSLRARLTM